MKGGKTPIHIMRWAPADYVNDPFVRVLLADEDFATLTLYHMVLNWSHIEGGDLPADPRQLAAVLGMRRHRVVRSLQVCIEAGKLRVEDGRVFHSRIVREVAEELEFRDLQSERGKLGGRPKKESDRFSPGKPPLLQPKSPPAPAPAPAPDARRQTGDAGPPANPLVAERRPAMEREVLGMVRELAALTDQDPVEVMAKASGYVGAATTKLNPANMSDDRLANTWRDLRADLAEVQRRKAAAGGPAVRA